MISRANVNNRRSLVSFSLVSLLLVCSFFVALTPMAGAAWNLPNLEITLLDQDFSQQITIPENIVLGDNLQYPITAELSYDSSHGAIEYKTTGSQTGSVYVGTEPFINGNISIRLTVNSDSSESYLDIQGSTFWIQAQTLSDGGARVFSYYQTSPSSYNYQYYDVPVSALENGMNTINLMISGTTGSLTVYHDDTRRITTPMCNWSVQKLPYYPITLPIIRLENEKGGSASWVSTLLYEIKETVNGGLVTAVPGNDFIPFGIDYPRDYANSLGTQYMSAHNQKGVAWADLGYLSNEPQDLQFIKSLLDAGWELGIHYDTMLNSLPIDEAQSFMREQYDQLTEIFGRSPTSWCSYQNEDNVTHAAFAYSELGMIWRNGFSGDAYIANIGNLEETAWTAFWSRISAAHMVYPSFTHQTDQSIPEAYSIGYSNFTKWIDNYDGKQLIGFNEYNYRMRNQIDTKIQYLDYSEGKSLKFSVGCNQFPTRLVISFPMAETAVVLKNGNLLVKNSDYSAIDSGHIVLFAKSSDVLEVKSSGIPDSPMNLDATLGNACATLTWSAPSSDGGSPVIHYLIYRASGTEEEELLVSLGDVLTFTDNSIINGHVYRYRIGAVNAVGESPLSPECSVVTIGTPSAPLNISAHSQGSQIILVWAPPASNGGDSIIGYKLYRGTSPNSEILLATLGNVLNYSDTAPIPDVSYYYRVSASNTVGEGSLSNEVSAAPSIAPVNPGNWIMIGGEQVVDSIIIILLATTIVGIAFYIIHQRKKRI